VCTGGRTTLAGTSATTGLSGTGCKGAAHPPTKTHVPAPRVTTKQRTHRMQIMPPTLAPSAGKFNAQLDRDINTP
jgi:hypothetical protein